jgi:uncharacterized membrane protein
MSSPDRSAELARTGPLARTASLALYAAMVMMGLMAGLFFAWDVSVMPGLARLDDQAFVTAMQILIVAIENLPFTVVLGGAFGFTAVAAFLQHRRGQRVAARWIMAALGFYVVALAITTGVHFPLNDALVGAGDPGGITDLAALRDDFERPWTVANVARTLTCVLALVCLGRALSLHGQDRASARWG